MATIDIVKATHADAPAIIEMAGAFLELTDFGTYVPYKPAQLGLLLDVVLAHGACFLAKWNGETIGMLAVVALPSPLSGDPHAEEIVWWVTPAHRTGRAGYYLLRAAEDWTRQMGLAVLKMVAPHGSAIGEFYMRQGYQAVETAYIKRFDSAWVHTAAAPH